MSLGASYFWNKLYKIKHLSEHYDEKISNNNSVGMDRVTLHKFEESLDENIEIINRKVLNGTYNFTRYRQLLISKGENRYPRCISIATMRDKLTISVLNEIIVKIFDTDAMTPMPQIVVKDIVNELETGRYDRFIKLDISKYYASINHQILMKYIRRKIRKKEIIDLIQRAIETPTISVPIKNKVMCPKRKVGVPEGLAISNALANIYMLEIDKKYKDMTGIRYWRYVDDILIFTDSAKVEALKEDVEKDIKLINLELNDKKDYGELIDGFEYLGYKIDAQRITVRKSSLYKLEQTLENIFRDFKQTHSKNTRYLEWKVNLRITGFVFNNNKYGWLFFYSQIDDISLLYHLDWLIENLVNRFDIQSGVSFKRYVRTYKEIKYALHTTQYIPNLDILTIEQKRIILEEIYDKNITGLDDKQINIRFQRIMIKELKDIEKDIQNIS